MTNTICGYEREVLVRALQIVSEQDANPNAPLRCVPMPLHEACASVRDPAKLAEIMADALRALGWHVYDEDPGDALRLPAATIEVENNVIHVELFEDWESCQAPAHGSPLSMPQTRAALLRLLTLPEGTPTNEVLKALEVGQYADPDELLNTIPAREPLQERRFDPDPDREHGNG